MTTCVSEMIGLNRNTSMGHLVIGGAVANIEAIWVARNLKYYPLGLQEALMKENQLTGARGYEVKNVLFILPAVTHSKHFRDMLIQSNLFRNVVLNRISIL